MKLSELRADLEKSHQTYPRFILPNGEEVPPHAHLTEVGHVVKNFIDCGGLIGKSETVVLQTHLGSDTDHRLTSGRLAKILQLGERVLPHDQFEVAIEYDCCVVSQYPIQETKRNGEHLDVYLGKSRTQCLARERQISPDACCAKPASACC